ncbi:hypothetical protein ACFFGH_06565 [Lysobacter korlensis]|uniref:Holin n=1 Tax=Lysobacter korlensis TaxID=553636 RepID=A0ABV6RKK4_9GAMM
MKPKINRRKLARAWDWGLVALGGVAAYLVTAMPALAPEMGKAGPWITVGIGVLNVLLNKLPKLPAE